VLISDKLSSYISSLHLRKCGGLAPLERVSPLHAPLHAALSLDTCTSVLEIHASCKIAYVYNHKSKLCRTTAEAILNREHPNVPGTGEEEPTRKSFDRFKLGTVRSENDEILNRNLESKISRGVTFCTRMHRRNSSCVSGIKINLDEWQRVNMVHSDLDVVTTNIGLVRKLRCRKLRAHMKHPALPPLQSRNI
jgi:hypothetical protein